MSYKEKSLLYFIALVTVSIVYYQVEQTELNGESPGTELAQIENGTTSQNIKTDQILP